MGISLYTFLIGFWVLKGIKRSSNLAYFQVLCSSTGYYYTFMQNNYFYKKKQRIWVFATNANFIIPKSQQPDDAYLSYFKLTLFDPPEFIVWNIYGLRHLVLKKLGFKNPSLWQRLNSFLQLKRKEFWHFLHNLRKTVSITQNVTF